MMIGSGFTTRDICDGQSLASPVRWPPHARKYPSSSNGFATSDRYRQVARTPQLLMNLALGKVESSPFDDKVIRSLRLNDMDVLEARGMSLVRDPTDRSEVQVDCRFTQLLVTAAEDPRNFDWHVCRRGPSGSEAPASPSTFTGRRQNGAFLSNHALWTIWKKW